jgi:hypothetical protein
MTTLVQLAGDHLRIPRTEVPMLRQWDLARARKSSEEVVRLAPSFILHTSDVVPALDPNIFLIMDKNIRPLHLKMYTTNYYRVQTKVKQSRQTATGNMPHLR